MNHPPSCACDLCRTARRLGISPDEALAADLNAPEALTRSLEDRVNEELRADALKLELFEPLLDILGKVKILIGHNLILIPKNDKDSPEGGWRCKPDCKRCKIDSLLERAKGAVYARR